MSLQLSDYERHIWETCHIERWESLRQYLINNDFELLTFVAKNSILDDCKFPESPSKQ